MSDVEPCNTCGSRARIRSQRGEGSMANPGGEQLVRVCTNPKCPMNTGEASAADRV